MNKETECKQVAIIGGMGLGGKSLLMRAIQEQEYEIVEPRSQNIKTGFDLPKPSKAYPDPVISRKERGLRKVEPDSDKVTEFLKRVLKNHYKNTECFCGSAKKLKKCCRQLPEPQLRQKIARVLSGE